ncbi:MAG: glycosyltransferase family 39 protein [Caldilineaceae bacterium]
MDSKSTERAQPNRSLPRGRLWLLTGLMALLIWLPRGLALDRFVTADEHAWLARSGNFYRALALGDYAATFQRYHPGVTVTWAGLFGYLWRYPAYAAEAPREFGWLTEEIEPFLRSQGIEPIVLLAAGRTFIVLFVTLALTASFALAMRLLGWQAASMGMLLIALDPFHVGLSRLMHLDGLLSSFALLSVLAFLQFTHTHRIATLLLSSLGAGLAWLTRSPGIFLVPFVALIAFKEYIGFTLYDLRFTKRSRRRGDLVNRKSEIVNRLSFRQWFQLMFLWGFIAAVLFFLLWPAMWVDPVGSLRQMAQAAGEAAAEGHLKPTFYNGQIYSGDPGLSFYAVTYLWRTTPLVLVGLALALAGWVMQGGPFEQPLVRKTCYYLLLFAAGYGLFISLGAKKFDRYLLPAYPPLALVAGVGWAALVQWMPGLLTRAGKKPDAQENGRALAVGVDERRVGKPILYMMIAAGLILGIQAIPLVATFPYYLSYYDPLMGGSGAAPNVMQIGWGEGADAAARWLVQEAATEGVDAHSLKVATAYTNGPFSYFFPGESLPIYFWHTADFAVLYRQDFQRRLPAPRQIAFFEQLAPVHTVRLNGIDYAQIYDLRPGVLPAYVTDWRLNAQPVMRLVSYQFPSSVVGPGEALPVTLYLLGLAPLAENVSIVLRLVGADGAEIARDEGWPWGSPTSTWRPGDVWPDGHMLMIPPATEAGIYRLDIAFVEPVNGAHLPGAQPSTSADLGEWLQLDYASIGSGYDRPTVRYGEPFNFGGQISLVGLDVQSDGALNVNGSSAALTLRPGAHVTLAPVWRRVGPIDRNYTVFAQVWPAEGSGAQLTQHDQPPLNGFLPTTLWRADQLIRDHIELTIPSAAAPGRYFVRMGFYDPETLVRLGVGATDSVDLLEIEVEE